MGTYKYLTECNRAIGADRDCNPPDFRQSQLVASQLGRRRSDHVCHREAATTTTTFKWRLTKLNTIQLISKSIENF